MQGEIEPDQITMQFFGGLVPAGQGTPRSHFVFVKTRKVCMQIASGFPYHAGSLAPAWLTICNHSDRRSSGTRGGHRMPCRCTCGLARHYTGAGDGLQGHFLVARKRLPPAACVIVHKFDAITPASLCNV